MIELCVRIVNLWNSVSNNHNNNNREKNWYRKIDLFQHKHCIDSSQYRVTSLFVIGNKMLNIEHFPVAFYILSPPNRCFDDGVFRFLPLSLFQRHFHLTVRHQLNFIFDSNNSLRRNWCSCWATHFHVIDMQQVKLRSALLTFLHSHLPIDGFFVVVVAVIFFCLAGPSLKLSWQFGSI